MIKGSVHQKDIIVINIYVFNTGPSKYIKQILIMLKEKIDNSIIIIDCNMSLSLISLIDCKTRPKINKT